jgi:hypothetical protein
LPKRDWLQQPEQQEHHSAIFVGPFWPPLVHYDEFVPEVSPCIT